MFYRVFRGFLGLCLRVFYRRIEAPGLRSVPAEGPLLLVVNHANALMDSLILLMLVPRRISFLAKHTLFPLPVIGFVLKRIGGIPVYRRQDDSGASSRNEETFAACGTILQTGGAVCIFPEGISHDRLRLQPLKTGAARIFFRATERSPRAVTVLPVGLNYEGKQFFRSRVLVLFGAPVPTGDLLGAGAGPSDRVERLTCRIEEALESLLPGLESYEDLTFIREIQNLYLGREFGSLAQEAPVLKRFIDAYRTYLEVDPEAVHAIRARWEAYRRQLARFSLTDAQVELAEAPVRAARFLMQAAAVILLVLPLALVGLAVHVVPYRLCGWVERRFNRHPDLAATTKLLAGLAFLPLTYGVVLALPVMRHGWRALLAGLILLPLSGWAALLVVENRQRLTESAGALLLALSGGGAFPRIQRERQIIVEQVADLVRKQARSRSEG